MYVFRTDLGVYLFLSVSSLENSLEAHTVNSQFYKSEDQGIEQLSSLSTFTELKSNRSGICTQTVRVQDMDSQPDE